MNIYNIVTKTEKSYDERISQLQAKVKELEEQTSGSGKTITADETGYFVFRLFMQDSRDHGKR